MHVTNRVSQNLESLQMLLENTLELVVPYTFVGMKVRRKLSIWKFLCMWNRKLYIVSTA